MNSVKTPSKQREIKSFEKFGFTINFGVVTECHPKYDRTFKDQDGMTLTLEDLEKMSDAVGQRLSVLWELTDGICESKYVEFAERIDPDVADGRPCRIELWSTVEASILGTVLPTEPGAEFRQMQDPCAVLYDGKARINLVPLFNVARIISIRADAIKSITPPNEILVGLYPGFILQNRQSAYQLKPKVALEISPELTNDAEEYQKH
jgi:hypothetical protein